MVDPNTQRRDDSKLLDIPNGGWKIKNESKTLTQKQQETKIQSQGTYDGVQRGYHKCRTWN